MIGRLGTTTLTRDAVTLLAIRITGGVVAFSMQLALARLLGVTEYGIFVYAFSWLVFLSLFSRMGLDTMLTRFSAQYRVAGEVMLLRRLVAWSSCVALAASVIAGITASIVAALTAGKMVTGQAEALLVAAMCIPLATLAYLRQGTIRGLGYPASADLPETLIRPVVILLLLGWAWWADATVTGTTAMIMAFAGYMVASMVGTLQLQHALPGPYRISGPAPRGLWMRIALPLLFMQGMHLVLSKLDILMLGTMVGPDAAGVYGVVSRIGELAAFGLAIVNAVVAPRIAELFHSGKLDSLQAIVTRSVRMITVITLAISGFLFLAGEWVLGMFGDDFVPGYLSLTILLIGQSISALCGSVGYLMTMTGHQKAAAIATATAAAGNLILNWLLIPRYGINGAALATATTLICWNGVMMLYVRARVGIRSTVL